MDGRHRVYYLVNLNQNYRLGGWWHREWDNYGLLYNENLKKLKQHVASLKMRPRAFLYNSSDYFQMTVSCKKDEERSLISILQKLPKTNYAKINPKTREGVHVNAKKCDRCGRYYDKNYTKLKSYDGVVVGVSLVRAGVPTGIRYIKEMDLCDECIEEFQDFMLMRTAKKED